MSLTNIQLFSMREWIIKIIRSIKYGVLIFQIRRIHRSDATATFKYHDVYVGGKVVAAISITLANSEAISQSRVVADLKTLWRGSRGRSDSHGKLSLQY